MKTLNPGKAALVILCKVMALLIWLSCSKVPDQREDCLTAVVPDTLRFRVVDQDTNKDLFFSASPAYTEEEIYFTLENSAFHLKPRVDSSATLGKYFYIRVNTGPEGGVLYAHIADTPQDQIQYSTIRDRNSGCPIYLFNKITINNTQMETDVRNRVILFKK